MFNREPVYRDQLPIGIVMNAESVPALQKENKELSKRVAELEEQMFAICDYLDIDLVKKIDGRWACYGKE